MDQVTPTVMLSATTSCTPNVSPHESNDSVSAHESKEQVLPNASPVPTVSKDDIKTLPKMTPYEPKRSTHCTIHRPSFDDLKSLTFSDFVRKVVLPEASVMEEISCDIPMELREGIVKVVLPEGFQLAPLVTDRTARGEQWQQGTKLGDLEISSPITQNIRGIAGVYEYTFLEQKPCSLWEFRDRADSYRKSQVGSVDEEDGYTSERLEALERLFWKRLSPTMSPAWYGADQQGSLFAEDDPAHGWSIGKLDSCLHVLDHIPGVTSPYLYAGMWGSVFCAHTEDMNLLSINYLHAGQPKFWYAVAEPDAPRFLTVCQFHFALQAGKCPEFLRHKRCLISPAILKKAGIRYQTAVQFPGEAIITFPASYHFGFNMGFNVAEATNFGVPEWLPFGRKASVCLCRPHAVRINVSRLAELLKLYEHDQKRLRRGSRLSWSQWSEKRRKQQEEEEAERKRREKYKRKMASAASAQKKKGKVKQSEQQRRNEFWVEVVRPTTGDVAKTLKAKTPKPGGSKGKALSRGTGVPSSTEVWHLAKPIRKKQGLALEDRVLCMLPGTTNTRDEESSDDDEEKTLSEEEQCFAGIVTEIDDNHS
ncbi:jumonji domain-containing protein 2 [Fistulifera solaris]|uniref:Jumonji domain-containing protein 2 n=1 Tax=Fistulifera solaris TaxID=1519565 RepID=A0A1Z5JRL5_FISSO|nr:jumonji domain-containing protein 2 [Fistulifera solaris]|eukprot:GAX16546.1 jumonji domain-containing protein 2 [Fistulifera solaris]